MSCVRQAPLPCPTPLAAAGLDSLETLQTLPFFSFQFCKIYY